jgi:hypothetical protein
MSPALQRFNSTPARFSLAVVLGMAGVFPAMPLLVANADPPAKEVKKNGAVRRFFSDDSFWNRPLGENPPTDEKSSALLAFMSARNTRGFWINLRGYTIPVCEVGLDTPRRKVYRRFEQTNTGPPVSPGMRPTRSTARMPTIPPTLPRTVESTVPPMPARAGIVSPSDGWRANWRTGAATPWRPVGTFSAWSA